MTIDNEPFIFDYFRIPEKYRIGRFPTEECYLWRGDLNGLQTHGIWAKSIQRGIIENIESVRQTVNSGCEEGIHDLIDEYTEGFRKLPFVSATYNPQLAQVYAREDDSTIYRIRVHANRCIIDIDDIGGCGESKEILVFGRIFPHEIVAAKIKNDVTSSELKDGSILRRLPLRDSKNRKVKNPENWIEL